MLLNPDGLRNEIDFSCKSFCTSTYIGNLMTYKRQRWVVGQAVKTRVTREGGEGLWIGLW